MNDQTYTRKPPLFHAHQFSAATDSVDDLNAWANGLFPGVYPMGPFRTDGETVSYFQGGNTWTVLPDGFWVVLPQSDGGICIVADSDFEAQYTAAS